MVTCEVGVRKSKLMKSNGSLKTPGINLEIKLEKRKLSNGGRKLSYFFGGGI